MCAIEEPIIIIMTINSSSHRKARLLPRSQTRSATSGEAESCGGKMTATYGMPCTEVDIGGESIFRNNIIMTISVRITSHVIPAAKIAVN